MSIKGAAKFLVFTETSWLKKNWNNQQIFFSEF